MACGMEFLQPIELNSGMWRFGGSLQGAGWLWVEYVFNALAYLALAHSKFEQNPFFRLFVERDFGSTELLPA